MSVVPGNPVYKVTSLLIKTAILIFSLWYIFNKLNSEFLKLNFSEAIQGNGMILLLLTFFLMFINWGLEAAKWRILVSSLEKISLAEALKAVFAGVTVSIFMPNRVGEFAGRIFFLKHADKVLATLKNFVGSAMQLFMTLFFGILAFACVSGESRTLFLEVVGSVTTRFVLVLIAIFMAGLFILNRYSSYFSGQVRAWLSAVFNSRRDEVLAVLLLSFVRYFVFLFQYYFVLTALGVEMDLFICLNLIAVTFLVTSIIPSFALTEIATRGAAAVFLFSVYLDDPAPVLAASVLVWLINLAVPAVIGSIFIWQLKFFREAE
ncbi:MAG TPA: lysylphosphatidylglycerol synthase domain-containing protein [Bacteroidia bacterium]|jgi:hypothetical protein